MTPYRLYSVDGAGKIVAAESLYARNDDEAVKLALALNKSGSCEIWNRTKFVQAISGFDRQWPTTLRS